MLAHATEAVLPDLRTALARAQQEVKALSQRLDEERAGADPPRDIIRSTRISPRICAVLRVGGSVADV